ncbi:MAG: Wzz/FepE/Etk N-terminal domain-containing protein [Flavobacteriales bacterium]|nr:Wzz/FepE/Etk N-terminal domain-containing protein [Flavobacteriales bacterium]
MKHANKNTPQQYFDHEDEIDLVATAKTLWEGRKEIIKITLIFSGFGLFLALTSPTEFTSTIVVKPTLSNSKSGISGGLGGLAAIAGINIDGAGSAAEIHPNLYPKIIDSFGFQKELMKSPISVKNLNTEVSYEEYYTQIYRLSPLEFLKKHTIGLPNLLFNHFKSKKEFTPSNNNGFQIISKTDKEIIERLKTQVRVIIDEKQGVVQLSASMPEPLQAAQMVVSAQNLLQSKVINHKLKKAGENLDFIVNRFNEKKREFKEAQDNLAKYRDANKNVNSATAQTEAQRLESEYQLAFSIFSELAKQVETQKIKVKENTPVFAVLQNAVVPLDKSNTSKKAMLIISAMLGVFVGAALTFVKTSIESIKTRWAE